ncbi:MAG TPA: hypothetical protein VJ850_06990 [Candidatus Limnocylindrales bacterium]|nr:hypothetical protein [Candidatus Limnocylindrales bacterium]
MRKRALGAGFGVALSLLVAGTAFADSCANISRAAPPCGMSCTEPVVSGNWVWLPSVGVDFAAWGFAPPGGDESVANSLPGANGNYLDGFSDSLLGRSAYCLKGVNTDKSHGVVSGCE